MHEDIPLFFRRIVQERKLGHPDRLPSRLVDQIEFLAEQETDAAQHIMDDGRLVGAEEHEVAGLGGRQRLREGLGV